ncbi:hypothetical protein DM01DRAFT_1143192 [Hesseltinella vesiculosa]|uniref:Uncharacterized protein n=1 Tax=Hesseltinella vesiculosa TaxID=101127 RepID=A0A1X2G7V0_9FUNG|nr:hypothetical protein DM01DRAFT_1143192 [Hesseltinella vesiculosa]
MGLILRLIDLKTKPASPKINTLFSVEYHDWYKVVTNHAINQKYALVCCGQSLDSQEFDAIVNVPLQSAGIDGAVDILPFLDLLGLQESVKFIRDYKSVTSPCYSSVQQEDGQADAVFLSSQANTRPNGIVFSASDRQLSPLAQAAWLHYVALFFDREGLAASIYDQIKTLYDCHQSNMEHVPDRPSIAWTVNNQKEWIIYHDLYYQQLTSDAGKPVEKKGVALTTPLFFLCFS